MISNDTSIARGNNDVSNSDPAERGSFCKQLALQGTTIGLSFGMVLNFINSNSIFHVDREMCKNAFEGWNVGVLHVFKSIHEHREISLRELNSDIMKPSLFNPILPLSHIIPMVAFLLWNVTINQASVKLTIKEFAKKQIVLASKCVIDPFIQNIATLIASIFLRHKLNYLLHQEIGIKLSGHVLVQSALAIYKANNESIISNNINPEQFKFYSTTIASMIFISDALWAYNTAKHCHSVADVAATVTMVGLLYLGVLTSKKAITKVINCAVSKIIRKTKIA
jgi:hypothetical protein